MHGDMYCSGCRSMDQAVFGAEDRSIPAGDVVRREDSTWLGVSSMLSMRSMMVLIGEAKEVYSCGVWSRASTVVLCVFHWRW